MKLLLVNGDSEKARELIAMLASLGHEVLAVASDGESACRLCQDKKPDLVLMDAGLSGVGPMETAARINRHGPLPVVLIGGRSGSVLGAKHQAAGVCGYLARPLKGSVLAESLALAYDTFMREQDLRRNVQDISSEIKNRKLFSQAQGIVMAKLKLSPEQASSHIDRQARRSGLSPAQVAQSILDAKKR